MARAQDKLKFNGNGVTVVKSGHLRYTSPPTLRGKYVHRHEVEQLIDATPFSIRLLLPFPYEVHHMNYNKQYNCSCNYLLVSEAFHSAMTADRPRADGGRFGRKYVPKWQPPKAQWELELKDIADAEAVPF